jgi:hypothetical protein
MQLKVYMRIARTPRARDGFKVDASTSPNPRALTMGQGQWSEALHTVRFALTLDIPNELLRPADWPVIEVQIPTAERIPIEVEVSD